MDFMLSIASNELAMFVALKCSQMLVCAILFSLSRLDTAAGVSEPQFQLVMNLAFSTGWMNELQKP